ncbi:hypothetical protein HK101_008366 [Irineochytrium annulatum]|nr:hypothetical protein HK101_008366 [Irineochytrium annulatum]
MTTPVCKTTTTTKTTNTTAAANYCAVACTSSFVIELFPEGTLVVLDFPFIQGCVCPIFFWVNSISTDSGSGVSTITASAPDGTVVFSLSNQSRVYNKTSTTSPSSSPTPSPGSIIAGNSYTSTVAYSAQGSCSGSFARDVPGADMSPVLPLPSDPADWIPLWMSAALGKFKPQVANPCGGDAKCATGFTLTLDAQNRISLSFPSVTGCNCPAPSVAQIMSGPPASLTFYPLGVVSEIPVPLNLQGMTVQSIVEIELQENLWTLPAVSIFFGTGAFCSGTYTIS